ncbi:MAG: hypothetical protein FWC73_01720 [Defluviitaleaceae bacterium]|nr:hypothetical protein [Defluviitaleaceae bacterium]
MEPPTKIVYNIGSNVFQEAGRLKASHKISLADSILLAQTIVLNGTLLTADHHEMEKVEALEDINILWIR